MPFFDLSEHNSTRALFAIGLFLRQIKKLADNANKFLCTLPMTRNIANFKLGDIVKRDALALHFIHEHGE